ncbi:MAG: hypothetical protein A6F71_04985 [Cycloclasticus sp. symbiont of Poecilosclerida sp. M]|nr:MAG: hypothetical protein A6F71_04985 [Cycloclasticus sp. symbiont of Poecilosclerida sp. M]
MCSRVTIFGLAQGFDVCSLHAKSERVNITAFIAYRRMDKALRSFSCMVLVDNLILLMHLFNFIVDETSKLIKIVVDDNSSARGLACIICNDYLGCKRLGTLYGAIKDSEALDSTFKHLNFATIVRPNSKKDVIENLIRAIALYPNYPPTYNCFAIIFSGHGGSKRKVYSNAGEEVDIESALIKPFDVKDTRIKDFPKLVFIDACRGRLRTKGTLKEELPKPVNFLIAYSARYGYVSYETDSGGIWMQKLAAAIKGNTTSSIGDVVSRVNDEVIKEGIEPPEYHNTNVTIVLTG